MGKPALGEMVLIDSNCLKDEEQDKTYLALPTTLIYKHLERLQECVKMRPLCCT